MPHRGAAGPLAFPSPSRLAPVLPALLLAVGAAAPAPAPAAAQPAERPEAVSLRLGAWFLSADSRLRIDEEFLDEAGLEVDFEDLLGLDDSPTVGRAEAVFRLGSARRHAFVLSYFEVDRDEETVPEIGGLPIDLVLDTELTTESARFLYRYSFLLRPGGELGFSVGVHHLDVATSVVGVLPLPLPFPVAPDEQVEERIDLPLPVFGLHGSARLGGRFLLSGWGEGLVAEVDDWEGDLFHAGASLEHLTTRHFGVGVGWTGLWVDVDRDPDADDDGIGAIDLEHTGVEGFLRLRF